MDRSAVDRTRTDQRNEAWQGPVGRKCPEHIVSMPGLPPLIQRCHIRITVGIKRSPVQGTMRRSLRIRDLSPKGWAISATADMRPPSLTTVVLLLELSLAQSTLYLISGPLAASARPRPEECQPSSGIELMIAGPPRSHHGPVH